MEYKEVYGLDGYYSVTKCGKIKSNPRVIERSNGRPHTVAGSEISCSPDTKGYYQFWPYHKDGKRRSHFVHKAVYETWVRPLEQGEEIDHINGDHQNNHVDNLQAVTRKKHAQKTLDRIKKEAYDSGYEDACMEYMRAWIAGGRKENFAELNTRLLLEKMKKAKGEELVP